MPIIKTKVPYFTGRRASVSFYKGIGFTTNNYLVQWFLAHQYTVLEYRIDGFEKTLDAMTIEDLKKYLQENGKLKAFAALKNKDRLLEMVVKHLIQTGKIS